MPKLMTTFKVVRCLAAGLRRAACFSLLAGVLLSPWVARADSPQWAYQTFPFMQAMNVEAVYEATHSRPENLIETIRRWGVSVQLVRSEAPALPLNPLLAGLPSAAPEFVRRAGFGDTYEGLVIYGGSKYCPVDHTTILIRDTAPSYTLIHEFVQSLLRPVCAGETDDVLERRFAAAYRRLVIYQRRLHEDPYKLLDPLWRRDILAAQADVAKDLFHRIRIGQSQEAIVEKVLSRYIDKRSPFFDMARRAQGLEYGELMINNAVDLFNVLHESVVFVEGTVDHLRQLLRDGAIKPGTSVTLTDEDQAFVAESARKVEVQLAVVRAELQVLKAFYSR